MERKLIRRATLEDMPILLEIYERARNFMISTGNINQWKNGYPSRDLLAEDIKKMKCTCWRMKMEFRLVLSFIVVLILVII